jgi:hypothetical protein
MVNETLAYRATGLVACFTRSPKLIRPTLATCASDSAVAASCDPRAGPVPMERVVVLVAALCGCGDVTRGPACSTGSGHVSHPGPRQTATSPRYASGARTAVGGPAVGTWPGRGLLRVAEAPGRSAREVLQAAPSSSFSSEARRGCCCWPGAGLALRASGKTKGEASPMGGSGDEGPSPGVRSKTTSPSAWSRMRAPSGRRRRARTSTREAWRGVGGMRGSESDGRARGGAGVVWT